MKLHRTGQQALLLQLPGSPTASILPALTCGSQHYSWWPCSFQGEEDKGCRCKDECASWSPPPDSSPSFLLHVGSRSISLCASAQKKSYLKWLQPSKVSGTSAGFGREDDWQATLARNWTHDSTLTGRETLASAIIGTGLEIHLCSYTWLLSCTCKQMSYCQRETAVNSPEVSSQEAIDAIWKLSLDAAFI